MMFDDAVQQALSVKNKAETAIVKLGTVTSVSNGRALVQHYGESTPSTKKYTAIDGYFPEVGDKVAMLPQGNTYIIIGKVIDAAPVQKYATITYVDTTAAGLLPIEYKNKLEDSGHSLTLSGVNFLPDGNETLKIGSSSKQISEIYTNKLYVNGTEIDPSGETTTNKLHTKYGTNDRDLTLTADGNGMYLKPNVNNFADLGAYNYYFKILYCAAWSNGTRKLTFTSLHNLEPDMNNTISIGTSSSKQLKNVYAQNVYTNGTAVTSDRRMKEDIENLDSRHVEFFKALHPVSFKYKDGGDRKHMGFVAQEVEEAVKESGMTEKDMAIVVTDSEGTYALRYSELIALQTKMIQELMQKVEHLEARIKKLEAKGEN